MQETSACSGAADVKQQTSCSAPHSISLLRLLHCTRRDNRFYRGSTEFVQLKWHFHPKHCLLIFFFFFENGSIFKSLYCLKSTMPFLQHQISLTKYIILAHLHPKGGCDITTGILSQNKVSPSSIHNIHTASQDAQGSHQNRSDFPNALQTPGNKQFRHSGYKGGIFTYPNVDSVLLHGQGRDNPFFFPEIKMEGNLRDVYLLLREANVSFTAYEYIRTVLPGHNHNSFNHGTKKKLKIFL